MVTIQKKWGLGIVAFVAGLSVVPTFFVLKHRIPVLPVFDFGRKLNNFFYKTPAIPFLTTIELDNVIKTQPEKELTDEEKLVIVTSLPLLFRVQVDNLAYYFKYFGTVEFFNGRGVSAFVAFFSNSPPELRVENNSKILHLSGETIRFDVLNRVVIYAKDNHLEFVGVAALKIRIFYSDSLVSNLPVPGQELKPKKERF